MSAQGRVIRAVAVALLAAVAASAQAASVPMKTVDTGLGFSISVPEGWTKGQPVKNNKFVMGAGDEDFSVIVADFGPAQPDAAQAMAVYRESLAKNGLTLVTERDIAGRTGPAKEYVFALETPDGPGHAEGVLVHASDEVYLVLVVTPAAALDARRPTNAAILGSVTVR
jgi:hypothetical protein